MSQFEDEPGIPRGPLYRTLFPVDVLVARELISDIASDPDEVTGSSIEATIEGATVSQLSRGLAAIFMVDPDRAAVFSEAVTVNHTLLSRQAAQHDVWLPPIPNEILDGYGQTIPKSLSPADHAKALRSVIGNLEDAYFNPASRRYDGWFWDVHAAYRAERRQPFEGSDSEIYQIGVLASRDCLERAYAYTDFLAVLASDDFEL